MGIETRLLDIPVVLLAAPYVLYDANKKLKRATSKGFLQRLDLLAQYNVRIMGSEKNSNWSRNLYGPQQIVENQRPGLFIKRDIGTKKDMVAALWPHDLFSVLDGKIFVIPGYEECSKEVLSSIGLNNLGMKSSYMGMGGYFVKNGRHLVVSEAIITDDGESSTMTELKDRGYKVDLLPIPTKTPDTWSDSLVIRMLRNKHIDTEFNMINSPQGNSMVFVNEAYFEAYRDEVHNIAKSIDAKLTVLPEGSNDQMKLAVNFMKLPDGKVMIPNRCMIIEEAMVHGLGRERVLVTDTDNYGYSGRGGGLCCMSNIIK